MKTQTNKITSLKKLTIARINPKAMHKIQGGECEPTNGDTGSHNTFCECEPGQHRY